MRVVLPLLTRRWDGFCSSNQLDCLVASLFSWRLVERSPEKVDAERLRVEVGLAVLFELAVTMAVFLRRLVR